MSVARFRIRLWLLAALVFLVSGCANFDKVDVYLSHIPEKQLYWRAHDEMLASNYKSALNLLSILQISYPHGTYYKQAIIDTAYIHYLQNNVDLGIAACDHFLKLFPNEREASYVLYLKGIIYFNENKNFLARLVNLDVSTHDQKSARLSFAVFQQLIDQYPHCAYAEDAREHMAYLVDLLSRSELHIALYALRHAAYIAAINRSWRLIHLYPQSYQTEKAMVILIYSYKQLGFADLSNKAHLLLLKNFPQSAYLNAAYLPHILKES